MHYSPDTICAIATPPGRGGVGVIRISGPDVSALANAMLGALPAPRYAKLSHFLAADGSAIDSGIALYFPAPHSFTGEDVLELQGHGGPVVLDMLLERLCALGARLARPGEFSERAFLHNKIDLAQAEAIADLIDSASRTAARLANRSLQGAFSEQIHALLEQLIALRTYVEAAIDFPEEDIDFLADDSVRDRLEAIENSLHHLLDATRTGVLLREGMQLVIAGLPNAGKSSLLNALSGRETAIVTDQPGTTRDLLREQIQIDGMPLHVIDTAGLRETDCAIEQEGVRRAQAEIAKADLILWVFDASVGLNTQCKEYQQLPTDKHVLHVANKMDLVPPSARVQSEQCVWISAKSGAGVDTLRQQLKQQMGYGGEAEGEFLARRRHLDALLRTQSAVSQGKDNLLERRAGELLAEDLRQAQQALAEITGQFTADDLLGSIFSTFCIGK